MSKKNDASKRPAHETTIPLGKHAIAATGSATKKAKRPKNAKEAEDEAAKPPKPPKRPKNYEGLHTNDASWWARPNRPLVIAAILSVSMVLGTAVVQTIKSDDGNASSSPRRTFGDPGGVIPGVEPTVDPSASAVPLPASGVPPPGGGAGAGPSNSASGSRTPIPAAGLRADHEVTSTWNEGFIGAVSITNGGPQAAEWTVILVVPAEVTIDTVWNATMARSDRTYTFKSTQGGTLQGGGTAGFGYSATHKAVTQLPESCKINDRTCE